MRNKFLSVKFLVIGSLVLGTLAWAAPAVAGGKGDRPVPPGFLFDKDAYAIPASQVDAGGSQALKRFSLKLYGGYNYMSAGDVNEGSDFYYELVEAYVAEGFGAVTGGYSPLHGGYEFGADLIYQITPAVGIGLGAGYVRSSADSLATFSDEDISVDLVGETMLSAVPIRFGLFFTAPLGGKLDLIANAGAAYYAGLKLKAMQGLEFTADDDWERMTVEGTERSGLDIGYHGSLGLEYKFSPTTGFFVEVVGRYAKLKNFKSVTGLMEDSGGYSDTTEGKLYIVSDDIDGTEISSFTIEETEPADPDYREPKIDLTGFSLRAGIHIRF
jgi:hypothetical protein